MKTTYQNMRILRINNLIIINNKKKSNYLSQKIFRLNLSMSHIFSIIIFYECVPDFAEGTHTNLLNRNCFCH